MYKITFVKSVGDINNTTILETDDVELIKEILVSEKVLEVCTDEPNQSISPAFQTLQDFYKKYGNGLPSDPYPFTVTC